MDLKELSNRIIDELYAGLTGGNAELPLPQNMIINWVQPGIAFHESAFDWAIAGPYAGPTALTLDYFRELVETIQGEDEDEGMTREVAIEKAKLMYQQQLLGGWEAWSRLVDFIPLPKPQQSDTQPRTQSGQGKYKHVSVVYGQAGQTLSQVYRDTLQRCEVAAEELTEKQKKLVERMRVLLGEWVEYEDLFGEKKTEFRDSRLMTAYKEKQIAYENAVIDYARRLATANNGTAADLIEWSRSGGIYKQRANNALREWIGTGYKRDVERAQAVINQILGTSMVAWVDKLRLDLEDIDNNMQGSYGYSFFPAAVLPGTFARNPGWSRLEEYHLDQKIKSSSSSRNWGAVGGLNLGFFSIGGSAGGSHREIDFSFEREEFGIAFDYTQVEIVRPAFNPNFFLSRGWRPKDSFIRDYQPLHSDGKEPPSGAMIGYPTKALFVRNLKIISSDLAHELEIRQDDIRAGAVLGIGPFCIGGRYSQSNRESESNLEINKAEITIKGLQLVAFLSAVFPYTANPSPDVKKWI